MLTPLFLIPITTLIFLNTLNRIFVTRNITVNIPFWGVSISFVNKVCLLLSLHINLAYSIILWKEYPKYNIFKNILLYPSNSWFELQHNLNLPFIILSVGILIVALLTAWYSIINWILFINLILILEICLIGAFSCSSIFIFLLFFEASAIPVFILIIYCGSNRRERIKAAYYFLFFTLYGSISLLLVLINIFTIYQISFISELVHLNNNNTLWLLLFIAFAIKVPLFPFHLWLPYAHVEANTSVSIVLAAIMLKLGGYGILKFMLPLFDLKTHLFFRPLALTICILGIVYGGLVAIRQIDLKRQIAFSSISHMSFAILGIFTFTEIGSRGAVYLMLSHGLSSTALFYLIGILSERYHTRSIMAYGGLLSTMPWFAYFLIFMCLSNIGFPGTPSFIAELLILISTLSSSLFFIIPVLIGMFLTTVSTLILLLRLLFGHTKIYYSNSSYSDISWLEFIVLQ